MATIEAFMAGLRAALPAFEQRPGQLAMIRAVADAFDACKHDEDTAFTEGDNFLCCESGTGTGKTFSYCIAGLVLGQSTGKKLVISSSTVALMDQLTTRDLPLLQRVAPFPFRFTQAKGRARYVCPARLAQAAQAGRQSSIELDATPQSPQQADVERIVELHALFEAKRWNGDRDRLSASVDAPTWASISTDRAGCVGSRCPEFSRCPFFLARQEVREADCVVTNHDLLLSALDTDPGRILPHPNDCFFVLDEAHSLADKVVEHYAERHPVRATYGWLTSLADLMHTCAHAAGLARELPRLAQKAVSDMGDAIDALHHWLTEAALVKAGEESYRFAQGVLPEPLAQLGGTLRERAFDVLSVLADARAELLKKATDHPEAASLLLSEISTPLQRAEKLIAAWDLLLHRDLPSQPPTARWIEVRGDDFWMCASPINAGDRLERKAWRRMSAAVLTSATLTSCGSFQLLLKQTGLHRFERVRVLQLPSPFAYQERAKLIVPQMRTDPFDFAGHTAELIALLPQYIDSAGTLALFASAKQMQEVVAALPEPLRRHLLIQGHVPKAELLARHRAAVDRGEPSLLCGLHGLAEGVDLPGRYCTRVLIAKLPFAVPSEPWEEARREYLEANGRSSFREYAVPEAGMRLAQMVGRLIRTTEDSGTVVVFDRRLVTKPYGRRLLMGLPPMRMELLGKVYAPSAAAEPA